MRLVFEIFYYDKKTKELECTEKCSLKSKVTIERAEELLRERLKQARGSFIWRKNWGSK